eukprot:augustus_masked-scaffold_25-processed-gene-3.52-mRNA-1 protein AED:1.00 eAED:1.00 QI:0/0/0/0/1/1/5/0/494
MSQTSDANYEQITEQKDKKPDLQAVQTDPVQSEASETPTSSRAKGRKSPGKKDKKCPRKLQQELAKKIMDLLTNNAETSTNPNQQQQEDKPERDSDLREDDKETIDSEKEQQERNKQRGGGKRNTQETKQVLVLAHTYVDKEQKKKSMQRTVPPRAPDEVHNGGIPSVHFDPPVKLTELKYESLSNFIHEFNNVKVNVPGVSVCGLLSKNVADTLYLRGTYLLSRIFVINKKEEPMHNKKNKLKGIRVVKDMNGIRSKDKIPPPKFVSRIKLRRLGNEARTIGIMLKEDYSGEFIKVKGLADTGADRNVGSAQAMERYKVEVEDHILIKEIQLPDKPLRKMTKVISAHVKLTQAGDQVDIGVQRFFCIDNPAWDEVILAKVTPIVISNLVDDIPEELNEIGIGEGNIEKVEEKKLIKKMTVEKLEESTLSSLKKEQMIETMKSSMETWGLKQSNSLMSLLDPIHVDLVKDHKILRPDDYHQSPEAERFLELNFR